LQIGTDQLQYPPISYPLRQPTHQPVVIDPIKKGFQINIHDNPITRPQIRLGFGNRLMRRATRPELITVLRKGLIPAALQDLQQRLLSNKARNDRFGTFETYWQVF
jgi:hypothetical protein